MKNDSFCPTLPYTVNVIAFQGAPGAYSDLACRMVFPGIKTHGFMRFEEAFAAVMERQADIAMIPVDNSLAGRVADVHYLLPRSGLSIIGEHFQPVRHCLVGVKGAKREGIRHVHSHIHALPQCRKILDRLQAQAHVHADTAGAAADIARMNDPAHGAIASALAAEIYGLDILQEDVQDEDHNTTRFLVLARQGITPPPGLKTLVSLYFGVRHIPAALYKALGGFATNGLSLAKLESYVDENFQAAHFYCEVEGHPQSTAFEHALEELRFYAQDIKILGAYMASSVRN
ncbi:MAG: prephenate dehydratase [Alphaproteobacteria bacterium]|nr:prephenate dehydratase [Alphaproteobacteria bacterium]